MLYIQFKINMNDILDLATFKVNRYLSQDNHKLVMTFIKSNNMITYDIITEPQAIYHLYSLTPYKHANNLTNLLFKDNKLVSLQTNITNQLFTIKIAMSVFITVELLYVYNKQEIFQLLPKYEGYYILDDISKIILQSHLLYSAFEDNKSLQESTDALILKYINHETKNTTVSQKHKLEDCKLIKTIYFELIKSVFNFAFLSYYALNNTNFKTDKADLNFNTPITIITSEHPSRIFKYIKSINKNIVSYEDHFYVTNDSRLKLTVINLINNGKKRIIMYIYNSLTYEVVPTVKPRIPYKYVIVRFLFLDLIKRKLYNYKPTALVCDIISASKLDSEYIFNDMNLLIGTFRDAGYDRILEMKKKKYFISPYIPLLYTDSNLRIVD